MLTRRRRAILLHIAAGIAAEGRPPSYRDIAAALGPTYRCHSIGLIAREIEALTAAGWVRHSYHRRDLEVLRLPDTDAPPLSADEIAWCHTHTAEIRALMSAPPSHPQETP